MRRVKLKWFYPPIKNRFTKKQKPFSLKKELTNLKKPFITTPDMKQIVAFQTTDGQTFTSRKDAETHELMIFVRGVIQSKGRADESGVTGCASVIAREQDAIYARLQKYRRTMQGLNQAENQKANGASRINLNKG